jgi:alkylation response protein AidB-like acyl-CoA dehydrogenase
MPLSGGGRMREYLVARLWTGAPVRPIYEGTNEIMKEIVGRAP